MANKPWDGRFATKTDRRVEEFTESISFDRRLFKQDIQGSIAHARMLARCWFAHQRRMPTNCARVDGNPRRKSRAGHFPFVLEREDIHMHVEAALIERLGDVGRKLHTARSRNDQVATDTKLWTRDAIGPDRRATDGPSAGLCGGRRAAPRRDLSRLHPYAARSAGAGGSLLPRLCREARPRPITAGRLPQAAERSSLGRRRPGRHDLADRPRLRGAGARV